MATADPNAARARPSDSTNHGLRVVVAWLVLSAIATPLVAIYVGPLIPPGNTSVEGQGQTFSNQVMVSFVTPILCLLAVFFAYGLLKFHARRKQPSQAASRMKQWQPLSLCINYERRVSKGPVKSGESTGFVFLQVVCLQYVRICS